jgi:prolyl-tRNA editing enzyme YbaK/EbsC (Cys-tRNA(Pro) deacylase)
VPCARSSADPDLIDHPNCRAVDAILAAAALPGRVRILPEPAPTAQAAADQLGCPVGAIANSLIFKTTDDEPLLVMTSGGHRVDLERLGAELGVAIGRADAAFVRTHTSQPIGGVAPVGHPRPLRTIVDVDLAQFDEVWAAGGIPHAVFPLSYADLVRLTGGVELVVGQPTARDR